MSRNAAWNLIRRIEKFGNFKKIIESRHVVKEINGTGRKVPSKTPGIYRITDIGMRYAKKLMDDMDKEILSPRAYRIKKEFEYLEDLQNSVMESI